MEKSELGPPGLGSQENDFANDDLLLLIKGAPDILLPYCSYTVCPDGTVVPIDEELRARIAFIQETWASRGQRVILLARKIIKEGSGEIPSGMGFDHALFGNTIMKVAENGLIFVGLVGIVVRLLFVFSNSGSSPRRYPGGRAYLSNRRYSFLHGDWVQDVELHLISVGISPVLRYLLRVSAELLEIKRSITSTTYTLFQLCH
jgi:hypothetical protein